MCIRDSNICSLDLSKAFDKVNHFGLYIKLMKRLIPVELLETLENWLSDCFAFVKWYNSHSSAFGIRFGVRQGSVLSPYLFSVYIDDVGKLCDSRNGQFVLLYADDILIITLSVSALQDLVTAYEKILLGLDMSLNVGKSCCIRIGSRHDKICNNIVTLNGLQLSWVNELRYLGIFIVSACCFKISLDHAKCSFFRAINAVFGKVGRIASEEVVIELLKVKCLPILLYSLEVCNLNKRNLQSLDFTVNRFFMKLFNTNNMNIVSQCQLSFSFELSSVILPKRLIKFESVMLDR